MARSIPTPVTSAGGEVQNPVARPQAGLPDERLLESALARRALTTAW
jgi:hypothetical protein